MFLPRISDFASPCCVLLKLVRVLTWCDKCVFVELMRSARLCLLEFAGMEHCKRAPSFGGVNGRTCWRDVDRIPELGLVATKEYPFRVYALVSK